MWNAVFSVLRSGTAWRDLPERFGPWESAYARFNTRRRKGVFERVLEALQIRLDAEGHIAWALWCLAGSSVRASKAADWVGKGGGSSEHADQALGRSRGGFGSKLHLVADGHGLPLAAHITAGQIKKCMEFETVVNRVRIGRRQRPDAMARDKGYSTLGGPRG